MPRRYGLFPHRPGAGRHRQSGSASHRSLGGHPAFTQSLISSTRQRGRDGSRIGDGNRPDARSLLISRSEIPSRAATPLESTSSGAGIVSFTGAVPNGLSSGSFFMVQTILPRWRTDRLDILAGIHASVARTVDLRFSQAYSPDRSVTPPVQPPGRRLRLLALQRLMLDDMLDISADLGREQADHTPWGRRWPPAAPRDESAAAIPLLTRTRGKMALTQSRSPTSLVAISNMYEARNAYSASSMLLENSSSRIPRRITRWIPYHATTRNRRPVAV